MIIDETKNKSNTKSVFYEDSDKTGVERIDAYNSGDLPKNISVSKTGLIIESGNFEASCYGFKYYLKHRLLKPFFDCKENKWFVIINKQKFEVALLVAKEYLNNPHGFKEVEYIDGNVYNYATINLKWKRAE